MQAQEKTAQHKATLAQQSWCDPQLLHLPGLLQESLWAPPCTHTFLLAESDLGLKEFGWREVQQMTAIAIQLHITTSRQTRGGCHCSHQPWGCLCYSNCPLHLRRGVGFWQHREALPSTPISLHHLCCMSWKQKTGLSSGQETEKIYTCAMHNC